MLFHENDQALIASFTSIQETWLGLYFRLKYTVKVAKILQTHLL